MVSLYVDTAGAHYKCPTCGYRIPEDMHTYATSGTGEPTADFAPVVHAHWMDTFQAENGYYMGICSHCYLPNIVSLYCGKCGAKMDEE